MGGGNASDPAVISAPGARGLIRPSSAAGARSSEMAGKFPGKVYQGEETGRFGKERQYGRDSASLELSGSRQGSRRSALSGKHRTLSLPSCWPQSAPPPPAARGSAPSVSHPVPAEGQRGSGNSVAT